MDSPVVLNVFYVIILILFFIMIYVWWGVGPLLTSLAVFIVFMFTIAMLVANAKYAAEKKIHAMKEEAKLKLQHVKDEVEKKVEEIKERVIEATAGVVEDVKVIVEDVREFVDEAKVVIKDKVKEKMRDVLSPRR